MTALRDARTPPGLRVYAIGDVHGHLDMLREVHRAIARDLEERPAADHRIVHLGDYIDRGPDSPGVIDFLIAATEDPRQAALIGNHDRALVEFMRDDPARWAPWLIYGGGPTCAAYGAPADDSDEARIRAALWDGVPEAHVAFLERPEFTLRLGDYLFVHAGIRPGVPLPEQTVQDLTWIREPFLSWPEPLGFVVVHGHTPTPAVELRPHRIGVDTGACFGGVLSCLVLEDAAKGVLDSSGYAAI